MNQKELIKRLKEIDNLSLIKLAMASGIDTEKISTFIETGTGLDQDQSDKLSQLLKSSQTINNANSSIEEQLRLSRERIMQLKELSNSLRFGSSATDQTNRKDLTNPDGIASPDVSNNLNSGNTPTEPLLALDQFYLIIDQGTAPDNEIAELLADISLLYRMQGGSGINFEIQGVHSLPVENHV